MSATVKDVTWTLTLASKNSLPNGGSAFDLGPGRQIQSGLFGLKLGQRLGLCFFFILQLGIFGDGTVAILHLDIGIFVIFVFERGLQNSKRLRNQVPEPTRVEWTSRLVNERTDSISGKVTSKRSTLCFL